MSELPPLVVFGAPDPESQAAVALIDSLNTATGKVVAMVGYAVGGDGKRVTPTGAYAPGNTVAIPHPITGALQPLGLHAVPEVALFECQAFVLADQITMIDHHHPGDPGSGRPPTEFLAASSIGQLIAYLAKRDALPSTWHKPGYFAGLCVAHPPKPGDIWFCPNWAGQNDPKWMVALARTWDREGGPDHECIDLAEIPTEIVLCAAADHCLGAAYRGECPGVHPDTLMEWRAETRAAFGRRSVAEVIADVEETTKALRNAIEVCAVCGQLVQRETMDGPPVCGVCAAPTPLVDMRREPPYPELPEAATRLGIGYIAGPLTDRGGRKKFICSGTPEQTTAFMKVWAPAQGLTGTYGDPARGFAGAYLP